MQIRPIEINVIQAMSEYAEIRGMLLMVHRHSNRQFYARCEKVEPSLVYGVEISANSDVAQINIGDAEFRKFLNARLKR